MKSTGILFQSNMVRAIGRSIDPKTQTRRIIDPQPIAPLKRCGSLTKRFGHPDETTTELWVDTDPAAHHEMTTCRFGGAGDELWVKETFSRDFANYYPNEPIWYKADDDRSNEIEVRRGVRGIYSPESKTFAPFKWTPSIFCSRDDSRTTLIIDNIRAQRLQEITEQDAIAEGIRSFTKDGNLKKYWWCDPSERGTPKKSHTTWADMPHTAVEAYRRLWNSINAKPQPVYARIERGERFIAHYVAYPWSKEDTRSIRGVTLEGGGHSYQHKPLIIYPNPYVWAITFQRK